MLIKCNIKRDPPSPTELIIDKSRYVFEDNGKGEFVCEVNSLEHQKYLLRIDFGDSSYTEYGKPRQSQEEKPEKDSASSGSSALNYKWPTTAPAIEESGRVSSYIKEKIDKEEMKAAEKAEAKKKADDKKESKTKEKSDTPTQSTPPNASPQTESGAPPPDSSNEEPISIEKRLQEIYELRMSQGFTFKQIAEKYGISDRRASQVFRDAKTKFEKKE